jgi:predicted MFS family arabinose efflux permease
LYYNQPILALMSRSFEVPLSQIGLIPTLTQLGYALGMFLFLPLGDRSDRRKLIVGLSVSNAIALCCNAGTTQFVTLAIASLVNGMTAVTPQLLVPFAAQLATPEQRGRTIGKVMSGLLLGIVLSRLFSGTVGTVLGWRSLFWIGAMLMLGLAIVLMIVLPKQSSSPVQLSYFTLLKSLPQLLAQYPLLQDCALNGAMFFGAYSGFWATLPFLLERPPLGYGSQVAGMFGLVGFAGTAAALWVGKLADRTSPRLTVKLAIALITLSFGVLFGLRREIMGLMIGATLLDLGTQTGQVSNQARIYTLPISALNRITTIYMVSYFLGGSLGSYASTIAWSLAGWNGGCAIGLGMMAIASLTHLETRRPQ